MEEERDTPLRKKRLPLNIHVILLAAIVLVIGFSAFRLYQWNKGERIEYDPNEQNTDFDVEVLDNIIPLAPDKREGYADDGVTTILCLGDDPFLWIRVSTDWLSRLPKRQAPLFITVLSLALP